MEGDIKEVAQQCVNLFTQCLKIPTLMENEWAENRLADMNLWISGTGACARGRASLDWRLASRPKARDVIVNLLRLLSTVIEDCTIRSRNQGFSRSYHDEEDLASSEHEKPGRSFSPWSDDSSSDSQSTDRHELRKPSGNLLYESMYNIESMLDQLSRVAVAIRRSGRRSRWQKADQLFNATEHQELEGHLVGMLLFQLKGRTQERDPSKLDEVQLRLVHCNLKRRNRFLYSQKHAMGLDVGCVRHTPVSKPAGSAQKETPERKPSPKSSGNSPVHANKTIITGTSASRLSDGFQLPHLDHAISVTSSAVSSTALNIDYPRPPQLKDDARLFRCPCCCEALSVTMTENIRWRKHIEDDLSPYTCVLAGCDQPYVLYNTKDSWRQHMLKDHSSVTYWTCFVCGDGSQFSDRDAFVQHTETFHAATIPPAHIAVLVELSNKTMPSAIRRCSLCNWPDDDGVEVEKEALFNHIATEVHSFSLRALPWADSNGRGSDEIIYNSSEKVYDWLIKNDIQVNPSIERPPCEKMLWYDDYFQQNAYFDCSSEVSSSNELDPDGSRQNELDGLRKADEIESRGQKSEANAESGLSSSTSNTEEDDGEQTKKLEIPMESRKIKLIEKNSDAQQASSKASATTSRQKPVRGFSQLAYFFAEGSEKISARVVLDTTSEDSFMSYRIATQLGVPFQLVLPKVLVPFRNDAVNQTSFTTQYQIKVDWHFGQKAKIYTTNFLVLDMDEYDVVIGRRAISRFGFIRRRTHLSPTPRIERGMEQEAEQGDLPVKPDSSRSFVEKVRSWFEEKPG